MTNAGGEALAAARTSGFRAIRGAVEAARQIVWRENPPDSGVEHFRPGAMADWGSTVRCPIRERVSAVNSLLSGKFSRITDHEVLHAAILPG